MQTRHGGPSFILVNVLRVGRNPEPGELVTIRPRDIRAFRPYPEWHRGAPDDAPYVEANCVGLGWTKLCLSYREFRDALIQAGVRFVDATHRPKPEAAESAAP